jgi:hypothetical protein
MESWMRLCATSAMSKLCSLIISDPLKSRGRLAALKYPKVVYSCPIANSFVLPRFHSASTIVARSKKLKTICYVETAF